MPHRLAAGACLGLFAMAAAPLGALAQSAPELKPAQTETKTIGVPSNAKRRSCLR